MNFLLCQGVLINTILAKNITPHLAHDKLESSMFFIVYAHILGFATIQNKIK